MSGSSLAALAALLFAALFVVGAGLLDDPGHDDSEQLLNDFYADSGNRFRVVVGSYVLALSGLAFLLLAILWGSRLPAARAEYKMIAVSSAAVFAGLLAAAAATHSPTYALSVDAFDEPQSELTRAVIPHFAYGMIVFGLLSAGLSIFALSHASGDDLVPGWLRIGGYLTAFALLFGILFMPAVALPLWAAVVGVTLLVRRLPESAPSP